MSHSRQSAAKLASSLYHYDTRYDTDICIYCGDPATTLDHIPPLAYAASIYEHLDAMPKRPNFHLVPTCRDCNSRLQDCMLVNIRDRRDVVRRSLRKRYQRLLGNYDWSDDEMAELGYNLRSYIKNAEYKRRWIMHRLRFPEHQRGALKWYAD